MPELPPLWVCGDTRVDLFHSKLPIDTSLPAWSWDSRTAADLPDERRRWFRAMDEAKPVAAGAFVLVASSTDGGVALIRRSDKSVVFSTQVRNAHSAELIPGGNWIAVAGSAGTDKLLIYHVSDGTRERGDFPLQHGHGAVFEPRRNLLWVGGAAKLDCYRWSSDASSFMCERIHEVDLPDGHAHDFMAHPQGGLVITTGQHVWRVDTSSFAVTPFEPLANLSNVKGVSIERNSGWIAYSQGQGKDWWTEHIQLLSPGGESHSLSFPGRQMYKVRWDQSCQLDQ
jgi:hypothetical protein